MNTETSDKQAFKISLALGLGVGLIYLAFLKPGIWGIDGTEMFWVSHSLVTKGSFAIPSGGTIGIVGRGGETYAMRYPLISLLATPFVAIGLFLANLLNLPSRYAATICALVLPLILTALTTSLVTLLALRLGSSKKGAYLAGLALAFGTIALVYAREFFAEPVLAFIIALMLYWGISKNYTEHAGASILAGLAILAKPSAIILGPIFSLYFFLKKYPWRIIIAPSLGTAMGVLLYLGYNYLRFESIFSSGQDSDRLQLTGMPERLVGMLLSPGAGGGLFWYCPPTILAIWGFRRALRSKPLEAWLVAGVFLGYWVLHSFWAFRGWNWGPRFLVPVLPCLLAMTALIPQKRWNLLIGLTLFGFFWNAPTLVSYYQRYYAELEGKGSPYLLQALQLWGDPSVAPLFNGWGAAFRQVGDALSTNVEDVLKNVGAPPTVGNLVSSDLLRIVAVWWWVLPAAGIPIWVGFMIALFLVGSGVWILRWGWRQTIDSEQGAGSREQGAGSS
ncbi:hypothetical protein [Aphanothece sacrum]|uniref:Glycosyltransferase RgtA/B/C/D-like domain-containing protein n=1 Tax=Aphanothece sacrum FPU1 TaxID=1920663 RepID=A0A401IGQ4_APHSA|nr:hypothetical protein [Aphanothece sacrum]GBF80463.1 hypothetical protein AsFPU1_1864 [Aphanothece sacrum FPU1]GBF85544.1 hypothetical protein AsFPU3_2606 [Aphanothece sacrum FPU3]